MRCTSLQYSHHTHNSSSISLLVFLLIIQSLSHTMPCTHIVMSFTQTMHNHNDRNNQYKILHEKSTSLLLTHQGLHWTWQIFTAWKVPVLRFDSRVLNIINLLKPKCNCTSIGTDHLIREGSIWSEENEFMQKISGQDALSAIVPLFFVAVLRLIAALVCQPQKSLNGQIVAVRIRCNTVILRTRSQ